jgi:hypothetical protein
MYIYARASAGERGQEPVQITGPADLERSPRPNYVAYIFVFLSSTIICRLYKLNLSDQVQVTLHLKVSHSDVV